MNTASHAPDTALDPSQLNAAVTDLLLYERVVVQNRDQAVQVYAAAGAREFPVHLPRSCGGYWTVELAGPGSAPAELDASPLKAPDPAGVLGVVESLGV